MERAERTFAALAKGPSGEAFNHLLWAVQDEVEVHRVVLAWRAWALLDLTGKEQAHTLLRQSVRYCVSSERQRLNGNGPEPGIRAVLPKLMDEHRLLERPMGDRKPDDAWVEKLSGAICGQSRGEAAAAVAAALAEGVDPEAIGEAMSLAANQLLLRDPGRTQAEAGKPVGSIHGASVGVHASDSANAWRNIARVSDHRNAAASLIVGAYHTAGQAGRLRADPYPLTADLERIEEKTAHGCWSGPAMRSSRTTRPRRARWCIGTESWGIRHVRCSTCCWDLRSARTERCTRRSTTAR
jgi:hypothetical protein